MHIINKIMNLDKSKLKNNYILYQPSKINEGPFDRDGNII